MNHPLRSPLPTTTTPPLCTHSQKYPSPFLSLVPIFSPLHLSFTSSHHSPFTHLTPSFPFPFSSTLPFLFQLIIHVSFLQSLTHLIPSYTFTTLSFPFVYSFSFSFPFHSSLQPSSFSPSPVPLYLPTYQSICSTPSRDIWSLAVVGG